MTAKYTIYKTLGWIARLVLGFVFIFSGLIKAIDPAGTAYKIGEYLYSFGVEESIKALLDMPLAFLVCGGEALLGIAVLLGWIPRRSYCLMALVMLGMTLLTAYIVKTNPVSDCGCFGDAIKISNEATFFKNLILLPLALLLAFRPMDTAALLSQKKSSWLLIAALLLLTLFMSEAVRDLPIRDFRPYHVGASLSELKGLTDGGEEQGASYQFVYQKDGVERTFTLDELSQVDSTWTYVRDESVEIADPLAAKGTDFIIMDPMGADLSLLAAKEDSRAMIYAIREISPKELPLLENTLAQLAKVAEQANSLLIVALPPTAATPEVRTLLSIYTYGEIDFTTLKTVVRSSQGLLLIDKGVIQAKFALDRLTVLLDKREWRSDPFDIGQITSIQQHRFWMRWLPMLLWLFVATGCIVQAALTQRKVQ